MASYSQHYSLQEPSVAYEFLTNLVWKRIHTINYIKGAHEGKVHWYNTILLSREDFAPLQQNPRLRKRTYQYFVLGMSLGTTLDITNPEDYIKALSNLLQEFEYFSNDQSKPKMKNIFFRKKPLDEGSSAEDAEYSLLNIANLPFEPDYFQVLCTLCDLLSEVYYRLLVGTSDLCTHSFCETVVKVDSKFKKIISSITKEIDTIARAVIKEELLLIDPLAQRNGGIANANANSGRMTPTDEHWDANSLSGM
ncbi:uncharacterized protein VTP21DRAFT_7812 [Calcarisporiella thermophila]|uniref:uncharacterized protein n=1 Tax=Calcarisporiella thermophila TaxID=911321 RepID=UPI003742EFF0